MSRLTCWNNKEKDSALPVAINELGDTVDLETICAKLATLEDAEEKGLLQIIDKDLFCRRAAKHGDKCAGYTENQYTHKAHPMCDRCAFFAPGADDESVVFDWEDWVCSAERLPMYDDPIVVTDGRIFRIGYRNWLYRNPEAQVRMPADYGRGMDVLYWIPLPELPREEADHGGEQ